MSSQCSSRFIFPLRETTRIPEVSVWISLWKVSHPVFSKITDGTAQSNQGISIKHAATHLPVQSPYNAKPRNTVFENTNPTMPTPKGNT